MLAVFSETNQAELTTTERLALHKLIVATVEGLSNPALFEHKTGAEQIIDGLVTSYALAWMEPYSRYFGKNVLFSAYFDTMRPLKTTRLGGDLTRVFNISESALAAPPIITEIK